MSYGVLGGERRGGFNTLPAWMVAGARELGPAIADAQTVSVGRVTVSTIEGLNELTDARHALAPNLGAVARTAAEMTAFAATQQLPHMPQPGETL